MFNDYEDMLTMEELCYMLRIGRNKAYELLRSGKIEGFQTGRIWHIPKQAVIDFIENSRQQRKAK